MFLDAITPMSSARVPTTGYARSGLVSQAATPEDYGPRGERLDNHRMRTAHDALGADLIAAALAGRPRELICTVRDVRRKVGSQGLVLGVRASTIQNGVRSAGHG
jgi:hypothetical protein